jgi:predicted RNA-binding Zn-ribbon protein involved in translation (DUF1610 family)
VGAKILTLDIETAPISAYTWGLWEQNVGLDMIGEEWTILSFSAKWLGEKTPLFQSTGGRGKNHIRDDKTLCKALWALLDEADIIIAQNGKAFDIKKINARFIVHGMQPYSPIKIIDTMLVAKKHFAFTSNKLEWMSRNVNKGAQKDKHKQFPGFELWAECLKDNPKAWSEMKKYNIQDVIATEELYLRMRPWIEGHPNVANYDDSEEMKCPRCNSARVQRRGLARTQTGEYHRIYCVDCGGWSRTRHTLNSSEKRKALLSN